MIGRYERRRQKRDVTTTRFEPQTSRIKESSTPNLPPYHQTMRATRVCRSRAKSEYLNDQKIGKLKHQLELSTITGRKRIIGARRACEQTSVFQLLGEIRERKHQHTMIHAHHHDQSVSTQVIVVLNFKIQLEIIKSISITNLVLALHA